MKSQLTVKAISLSALKSWSALCITLSLLLVNVSYAKTYYIVAMGDSMTSGEGAPDKRANQNNGYAEWEDDVLCHRSFASYATKTIDALRQEIGTEDAIVYKNFACSGAEISEGILSYQGKRLANGGVAQVIPQVNQVQTWMAKNNIATLDAVIMSVGVNDIKFAEVVKSCLTPSLDNCANSFISELPPYVDGILKSGYQVNLRHMFSEALKPKRIFVMEYPDPLRDAAGRFCDRYDDDYSIFEGGPAYWEDYRLPVLGRVKNITGDESGIAFAAVLNPLNQKIRSYVNSNTSDDIEWIFVDGVMAATQRHGYCAGTNRYFNHLRDSNSKQLDLNGILHPNDNGYQAIANVLTDKMKIILQPSNNKLLIAPEIKPASSWWGKIKQKILK